MNRMCSLARHRDHVKCFLRISAYGKDRVTGTSFTLLPEIIHPPKTTQYIYKTIVFKKLKISNKGQWSLREGAKMKWGLSFPMLLPWESFQATTQGMRTKVEPDGLPELKRRSRESEEAKAVTVPSIE